LLFLQSANNILHLFKILISRVRTNSNLPLLYYL